MTTTSSSKPKRSTSDGKIQNPHSHRCSGCKDTWTHKTTNCSVHGARVMLCKGCEKTAQEKLAQANVSMAEGPAESDSQDGDVNPEEVDALIADHAMSMEPQAEGSTPDESGDSKLGVGIARDPTRNADGSPIPKLRAGEWHRRGKPGHYAILHVDGPDGKYSKCFGPALPTAAEAVAKAERIRREILSGAAALPGKADTPNADTAKRVERTRKSRPMAIVTDTAEVPF